MIAQPEGATSPESATMTIPSLQNGELPPGEHQASLAEIDAVYGSANERRKLLTLWKNSTRYSYNILEAQ